MQQQTRFRFVRPVQSFELALQTREHPFETDQLPVAVQNRTVLVQSFEARDQLIRRQILQSLVEQFAGLDFEQDVSEQVGLRLESSTNRIEHLLDGLGFFGLDDHDDVGRFAKAFRVAEPALLKRGGRVDQIRPVSLELHHL